jgi:hypothetical protein
MDAMRSTLIPGCQTASVFRNLGLKWPCMYSTCYPNSGIIAAVSIQARSPPGLSNAGRRPITLADYTKAGQE